MFDNMFYYVYDIDYRPYLSINLIDLESFGF